MVYNSAMHARPAPSASLHGELSSLLGRHRAGDPAALNEIMVAIYPTVHRFVHRLAPRRTSSHDDLVQATLEQVCRAVGGFEGRSRLTTFVFGVCYRVVCRHRRAERIRRLFSRTEEEIFALDEVTDPASKVDERRALDEARRRLERLDGQERAAFVLFEVEGLAIEEIAAALEISERTVKRRLASARAKLLDARAFG
jgi:RNA polymerase sigma-70 factor, ECF subfamily